MAVKGKFDLKSTHVPDGDPSWKAAPPTGQDSFHIHI